MTTLLNPAVVSAARHGRDTAWIAAFPAGTATGPAALAIVRAAGPDAGRFLHSQLTSDVERLEPGAGSLTARVTRTGHLKSVASLHRAIVADTAPPVFLMLLPAPDAPALLADLDGFLFSDDLTLTLDDAYDWLMVQGPLAAEVCDATFGAIGFEPWASLPEHAIRPLRRARKDAGFTPPAGAFVIRRSLGGDVGFVIAWPAGHETFSLATDALARGGASVDAQLLHPVVAAGVIEIHRIEAGMPRVGPDTEPRRRLLPETGVEQSAVSYSKGCYLGQEVIARVRTYGSVPHLLRALVIDEGRGEFDIVADAVMGALSPIGSDLIDDDTGEKVGQIASRTWSPIAGAPVALAYLVRDARTPGRKITLRFDGGVLHATVALLPLHSAPDRDARVRQLHDRAIRTFADGDETGAIRLLEEALHLDPSFADAYEAIGVMLGRAQRFHEAIDVFRRLEEVAPDEPIVNTNLSLYYMKIGDKQTAEDEGGKATLKQMAKARGGSAGASVDADLEKSKRKDATRKRGMFQQVLEIDPDDPIALFGIGVALTTLDEADEAERHLAHAIEVDKHNSPVYLARGRALEKLERLSDAIGVYKAGIEVASRKGDLMPLKEMEHRLLLLGGR